MEFKIHATSHRLNEYDDDHTANVKCTLSVPLGFFKSLLRAKLELATKLGNALDLSCALSELSQS
ncbi:hypothetical protein HKD37_08G022244 [Glycine soja]